MILEQGRGGASLSAPRSGVSPAVGGINTQPVVWISLSGEGGHRENERKREKESNPSLDGSNQKEETDLGLSG